MACRRNVKIAITNTQKYGVPRIRVRRAIYDKNYQSLNKEQKREINRRWRANHPDKVRENNKRYTETHKNELREYHRQYREDGGKELRERERLYCKQYRKEKWPSYKISACKKRAKDKCLPFNMVSVDLYDPRTGNLPEVCPIFPHIRLDYGAGPDRRYWASVDRIVPELGYVSGNVCVVSMAANTWKTNGSNPEERKRIIALMRGSKHKRFDQQMAQGVLFGT